MESTVARLAVASALLGVALNFLPNTKQPDGILLPVIDLTALSAPGESPLDKAELGRQVRDASERFGVFYVTGHGLSPELQHATQVATRSLFGLPVSDKTAIPIKPGGFTRGYVGVGGESGSSLLEVKEGFSYGYDWSGKLPDGGFDNPLQGENVWPSSLSARDRATLVEFYDHMSAAARLVVQGFSLALGLAPEDLLAHCSHGHTISLMRLFHYLPASSATAVPNSTTIGSSPHTDWGFLTLILQDSVTGLQLYHEGRWHDVVPRAGHLLVNLGDYFSLLTHGKLVSPLHRVKRPASHRFSQVYFFYPDYDARISLSADVEDGSRYSLLKDQRSHKNSGAQSPTEAQVDITSFGAYILKKWSQVYREPNSTPNTP